MDSQEQKTVEIKGATLNDGLCNYSYEILTGATKGDTLNRKGAHIIHEDLEETFRKLNVFLAHLDDAFTASDVNASLEELEQRIETEKYNVTGFNISGSEENQSVKLIGYKEVKEGVIKFETPKVRFSGSYMLLDELSDLIEQSIQEVEAYMNGKTAPKDDPSQMHMDFASEDAVFEKAKV